MRVWVTLVGYSLRLVRERLIGASSMSELAKGCSHFLEYRQSHGLQSYKIIYKYLVKPGQEARKLKVRTLGGIWEWVLPLSRF